MKLTMNRRGEFRCNWRDTNNKCGVGLETTPKYTYYCHIETANILDIHGFVFDQLEIDKYFQKKYNKLQSAKSCERIAVSACEDVKRMIENHMLDHNGLSVIYRVAVTIGLGEDGPADMTAEWVPDAAKPIANVKRHRTFGDFIEAVKFPASTRSRRLP
jgi:hypothetical protein